jgi:hypothetical protein
MLMAAPIPRGLKVRRGFSFGAGEKSLMNRGYRAIVDRWLCSRYSATDYFFALSQQLTEDRFARVKSLASNQTVELMTHPVIPREQAFLSSERCAKALKEVPNGSYLEL